MFLNLGAILLFSTLASAGEYRDHDQRLPSLSVRIKTRENKILELIKHLEHEANASNKKHIIEEMKTEHEALITDSKEYKELRFHLRFKHPENGEEFAQKYKPYGIKSLDEMQSQQGKGIQGQLDKVIVKMKKIYGEAPEEPGVEEKPVERVPASAPKKYRLVK